MTERRRVVVTGLGVVSPHGIGAEAFWAAAVAGRSSVRALDREDLRDLPVRFGGTVEGFDPARWLEPKLARNTDRFVHLAVAASDLALEDAGLAREALEPARTGAVVASGIGGIEEIWEQTGRLIERGPGRVSPHFIPKMLANAASGAVAIRYGIRGPNLATVSACAAASHAIGIGLMLIRAGMADLVIAGGAEAAVTRLGIAGFAAARALSTRNDAPERASRPFDRDRDGFVMGEGAAVVVLEAAERATARGARIYAELCGFGATDDGHHMTAPEPEGRGAAEAMQAALADAGLAAEDVDVVSAHGTSTPLGDIAETLAIKRAFGDHARRLAVTATKSQVGHLLGAAGGIAAAAAVLAIARGVVPPTINLDAADPQCDLDYVPGEARERRVEAALVNAFGFGGHNATLAFRAFRSGAAPALRTA